jgi:hypothetical protein
MGTGDAANRTGRKVEQGRIPLSAANPGLVSSSRGVYRSRLFGPSGRACRQPAPRGRRPDFADLGDGVLA